MQQIRETVTVMALNRDDDPAAVNTGWQRGDSRYILNIRTFPSDNGDGGKAKSVKGNILVEWEIPAGANTCIGNEYDPNSDSAVIAVHNSLGSHSLLRYWHSRGPIGEIELLLQGAYLNFSLSHVVHSSNIVGDLYYWTDAYDEPRMINMARAAGAGKFEVHEIYLPEIADGIVSRSADVVLTRNGVTVAIVPSVLVASGSAVDGLEQYAIALAAAMAASTPLATYMTFKASLTKVVATALGLGEFEISISLTDTFPSSSTSSSCWDQPVSRYLAISDPYIINEIWPYSDISPSATYASDPKRQSNFVDRSLFQFSTRYLGADYQESCISSYSNTPIPIGSCIGGETTNNCIDVDFSSPRLINKDWLTCIRAVQILVRECLGTAGGYGPWKLVATLQREDFVLNPVYRFRNDQFYTEISDSDQSRPYDGVPLRAQTCEMIQTTDTTRQVIGGCTEDYDTPEVSVKYTTTFSSQNPISSQFFTVTGRVYIHAPAAQDGFVSSFPPAIIGYAGGKPARYYQGIHNRGDGIVYGGIGTAVPLPFNPLFADGAEPGVGSDYAQWLPEAGFCIYSAGTHYHTYTQQHIVGSVGVPTGTLNVEQGEKGVFDTSKYGYTLNPENASGRSALRWCMRAQAVYSTFTLQLPVGTNILRMASNLVSRSDAFGAKYNSTNGSLEYQRTSVPLRQFCGVEGANEFTVTGAAGDVISLPDTYVVDMTNPHASIQIDSILGSVQTRGLRSYTVDNNALSDIGTVRNGTRLELQSVIVFQREDPALPAVIPIQNSVSSWEREDGTTSPAWADQMQGILRSDHNGFAWTIQKSTAATNGLFAGAHSVTANPSSSVAVLDIPACTVTDMNFVASAEGVLLFDFSSGFYTGAPNIFEGAIAAGSGGLGIAHGTALDFIFYNQNGDAMGQISTTINGSVLTSAGGGVPNIRVLFENTGRIATTFDSGEYQLLVLADAAENLNNRGVTRTSTYCPFTRDRLVFQSDLLCEVTFIGGPSHALQETAGGTVGITQFEAGQQWSESVPYRMLDILCLLVPSVARAVFGRGSTPQIGIELMDGGGRLTGVGSSRSSIISIPFPTENLRVYDPDTYPADTYLLGPASIGYEILGSVPIPKVGRFTKWRFVVTQDGSRSRVFEWAANDVRYVERYDEATSDTIATSATSGLANEIYLGLGNIERYREQNTDSLVAYTPQRGDKIVMICRADGSPFTYPDRIIQSEVTGERTTTDTITGRVERWLTVAYQPDWPEIEPGALFMVYTPAKTTDTKAFYEVGPWNDIIDPHGPSPSWSSTTGFIPEGFTYYRPRRIPVNPAAGSPLQILAYIEDDSASDFYPSKAWSQGRVNLFDPNLRQVTYGGRQRWSHPYVPGTKTNGLSSYGLLDYEDLTTEFGPIERMVMVGEVLLIACWSRLVSRYPTKESLEQAVGGQVTASSGRILGASHVDNGNYGCSNGESISVRGNNAYGFDITNGLVWRKNVNATVSISGIYKMQRDIAEKARFYRSQPRGSFHIWSTIDRFFEEVIFCFPEVVAPPDSPLRTPEGMPVAIEAETLSFHEGSVADSLDNRWMTAYSYHPECMGYTGMEIISFRNGQLWLHNRNPVHNSFYGVQYPSEADLTSFAEPELRKRYLNAEVKASHRPNFQLVETDGGMQSMLPEARFIEKEGDFYAEFLRNILTPNIPDPVRSLYNGDRLVGNTIVMRLSIQMDDKYVFTCLSPVAVPSQRSQK